MGQMSVDQATHIPDEEKVDLWSWSTFGLLLHQFLGVFNDNLYKWLATNIGVSLMGEANRSFVLSVGSALFVLPYILFAAPAGFLADRYSKAHVIVITKFAEVVIMGIGVLGIYLQNVYLMLACIFMLGTQACFIGPAKLGALPELFRLEKLSAANAWANLVTISAILLGSISGYGLFKLTGAYGTDSTILPVVGEVSGLVLITSITMGMAILGFAVTLLIKPLPAAVPTRPFPLNPFSETGHGLKLLLGNRQLCWAALAGAYFWSLGCLSQLTIYEYGLDELLLDRQADAIPIGMLTIYLAIGVSLGTILAGILSQGRVELGIVPPAALGLSLTAAMLMTSAGPGDANYLWSAIWLGMLGFTGGLYDVPLMAYLQKASPPAERGQIFAANNFLTFFGMLVVSGLFYAVSKGLNLPPRYIFLAAGVITLVITVFLARKLVDHTLRFTIWMTSKLMYRTTILGAEHIPDTGGALLVCNHVSFADGILVGASTPRLVRLIAYDGNLKSFPVSWMARVMRTIPINANAGPKALLQSLQAANQALKDGDLVCIFAEGAITRTGQLQAFQRGILKIVEGTGAPIIPTYLDGMWGSIFSFEGGKFFRKWPKRWPYPVTLMFGKPIQNPTSVYQIRQAVQDLGAEAVEVRRRNHMVLPRRFIRECRGAWRRTKIADSTGQSCTGRDLLLRALVVRQLLKRILNPKLPHVGVLLPPSNGGVLVNIALSLLRRVSVNLNYTLTPADVQAQLKVAGIQQVITSRAFLEKTKFQLDTEFLCLEDLLPKVTKGDKRAAGLMAYAYPNWVLDRALGLLHIRPDDLLTLIFTSGSTGEPKGVMLSYFNVASNIDAIDQLLTLTPKDVLLGLLPFFHSFGYTATMWSVLTLNAKGVYHFNPLDARTIGQLTQDHKVTILMSTPTFLRGYIRRIEKEQFASLDLVITGAEKLPADLGTAFQEKFGVGVNEGYGTTELSPLASVNVPDHREESFTQIGCKTGTVGRPVPGVTAKIVDPDTMQDVGEGGSGLLLIKGPNVMQGYFQRPDKTAEVIRDGWYITGDIAKIDNDGFISITDRLSRFSKIGGEMVPHLKVEEALSVILALPTDEGPELRAVVTSVPDEKKGERLIIIHKPLELSPQIICQKLSDSGLPNLWVPAHDCFLEVPEIPVLGTGKLDLKGLKKLALEKFS